MLASFNWKDKFLRGQKKADAIERGETQPEILRASNPRPWAKVYTLVKIQDGIRTSVGWRLTEKEAEVLSRCLTKRMKKLAEFNDSGGPLFEITLSEIVKET